MFEMGKVRDLVVSTMGGGKVDVPGKSTMPYGEARVLYAAESRASGRD